MPKPGYLENTYDTSYSVAGIISAICARVGIPPERFNVRDIDERVDGFSLTNQYSAASAITSLAGLFAFDAANFDGRLNFIQRGGDSVATITYDDLVDDGQDIRKQQRLDAISVPRVLHLNFYELNGGLQPNITTSDRSIDNRSQSEVSTDTVAILQESEASLITSITHKVMIEESRGGFEFSLPDSYLYLTVGDVLMLDGNRLRITEVEVDEGLQRYKTVFDRASAYSAVVGTTIGVFQISPNAPRPALIGPTVLEVIDSHIIADSDDMLGIYVAASSADQYWGGAEIRISSSDGVLVLNEFSITKRATIGVTTTALGNHQICFEDRANKVSVQLLSETMTLSSVTDADLLNGANLAVIEDELIQFQTANEVSPGVWELSGLLRGRFCSTENGAPGCYGAGTHPIGSRFVLMDRSKLQMLPLEMSYLNREFSVHYSSFSEVPEEFVTTITPIGRSQIECAPNYLKARRDGGNLIVSWIGTGRLGKGGRVAHGSAFTGYRVTVGTTEYNTTAQTITIPDPGGTVTIEVGQVNRYTGIGHTREITI